MKASRPPSSSTTGRADPSSSRAAARWAVPEEAPRANVFFAGALLAGVFLAAALVTEVVLTAVFLLVILGSTTKKAAVGFAGMSIGLCLTLIHLIAIPVTNTSVNPARSTSQALFAGGWAISQLWMFWVAPILGAVIGALIWKGVGEHE